jgi:hypothetical protein
MVPIIGRWLQVIERRVSRRPAGFLLVTLTVNAIFVIAFDRISMLPDGGPDIVDLHASNYQAVFEQIVKVWTPQQLASAKAVLWLDLLFPIAYVPLFAGLYYLAIQGVPIEPRRLIAVAPFVAGVADVTENSLSLAMLSGQPFAIGVRALFLAAIVKFSLLTMTAAFILAALTRRPAWRVIKTARYGVLSLLVGTFPVVGLGQGRDLLVSLSNYGAGAQAVMFIVWLVVWAFSAWYWSRVLMDAEASDSQWLTPEQQHEFDSWSTWLPRWIGALTLIIPGIAMVSDRGYSHHPWILSTIGGTCIGLGAAFLWFVVHRKDQFGGMAAGRATRGFAIEKAHRHLIRIFVVSVAISFLMFWLLTFRAQTAGVMLGAAAILAVAAANTVFFGSVAAFFTRAYGPPIEALLIASAIVFSLWNDNHRIQVERPLAPPRLLKDALEQWTARAAQDVQQRAVGIIVVAEGGGIRAAYWTSAVLHLLDSPGHGLRFSDRLFAISSVSGSSLGAAVYAGLKKDLHDDPVRAVKANTILRRRFLAPMVGKLVTGDFAQWFIPTPIESFDRSTALEDGFANAYADVVGRKHTHNGRQVGAMSLGMSQFRTAAENDVPELLFNTTSVRTGRRVVASTLSWLPNPHNGRDPIGFHEFANGDISATRAAHNSARFPGISAAGALRGEDDRYLGHLVDGGYFENTGADTAIDLIAAASAIAPDARFVVISIANSPKTGDERDSSWRRTHFLGEVLGPLRALFRTRDARGVLAIDRLKQLATVDGESWFFDFRPCFDAARDPMTRKTRKFRGAPLGWQLSDEAATGLDDQLQEPCVVQEVARLKKLLIPSP